MTRAELRTVVEAMCGRDDKTTQINIGLEQGLRELCKRFDFREMRSESDLTIASGDVSVSLPSTMHHLMEARILSKNITQVETFTPASVEVGDIFTLTATSGNSSTAISFTATGATVADVTSGLTTAWNNSSDSLITPVTASDNTTHVTLTADASGTSFSVTSSTTDGGGSDDQTLTRSVITANQTQDSQAYKIDLRTKEFITRRWPFISSLTEGKPTKGYVEGTTLFLYPISNGAYTIRVTVSTLPTLDEDTDSNPVTVLDYALECYATGFVYDTREMFREGDSWRIKAELSFIDAKRSDLRTQIHRVGEGFKSDRENINAVEDYLDPFAGHTSHYDHHHHH